MQEPSFAAAMACITRGITRAPRPAQTNTSPSRSEAAHDGALGRGRTWLCTLTTEFTINTAQGMIESVARTSTNSLRGSDMPPASVPDYRTSVTTTVADSTPQP